VSVVLTQGQIATHRWGKYLLDEKREALRDAQGNKRLDPEGGTIHSLRTSKATAAGDSGMPIERIMLLGNWKSRKVPEGRRRVTSSTMISAAAAMANLIKPKNWTPADEKNSKQKTEAIAE